MTSELKPCPFCGGKAVSWLHRNDDHERYAYVSCEDCPAETKGKTLHWGDNTDAELSSQLEAALSWNTRTVPDVPELVRYSRNLIYAGWNDESAQSQDGEYVRHDQAAAVIGAKEAEIASWKHVAEKAIEGEIKSLDKLRAAEAKLAQIEKQEAIGYISRFAAISLKHKPDAGSVSISAYVDDEHSEPLYTAPVASDADLRAENERLRLSLEACDRMFRLDIRKLWDAEKDNFSQDVFDVRMKVRAALNPSDSSDG